MCIGGNRSLVDVVVIVDSVEQCLASIVNREDIVIHITVTQRYDEDEILPSTSLLLWSHSGNTVVHLGRLWWERSITFHCISTIHMSCQDNHPLNFDYRSKEHNPIKAAQDTSNIERDHTIRLNLDRPVDVTTRREKKVFPGGWDIQRKASELEQRM